MPISRTSFALWLDGLLLLLFLLIQSPRITGVAAHEWLGIAIAVPLLLHMLLSWHWITSKARRLFANGSLRTRINYAINLGLFLTMALVIVSGIMVSRVVLAWMRMPTIYDGAWFELHDSGSNVLFVAIGLHLALNWGWVLAALRRRAFTAEELEASDG